MMTGGKWEELHLLGCVCKNPSWMLLLSFSTFSFHLTQLYKTLCTFTTHPIRLKLSQERTSQLSNFGIRLAFMSGKHKYSKNLVGIVYLYSNIPFPLIYPLTNRIIHTRSHAEDILLVYETSCWQSRIWAMFKTFIAAAAALCGATRGFFHTHGLLTCIAHQILPP